MATIDALLMHGGPGIRSESSEPPKDTHYTKASSTADPGASSGPIDSPSGEAAVGNGKNTSGGWRPAFHITPPHGWLNDPCAPGYDATHDVYHLGFQWNGASVEWDSISWAAANSRDLVTWEIAREPSLTPTADQDRCGVFTGCMSPESLTPGTITAFYTSAAHLPIHHTLPYKWGSEALHMAVSSNSGRTWRRFEDNPVLPGPPAHLDVTGWRDPYVAPWPSLSIILGQPTDTLYGVVSGGIRGRGPTVFLYRIDASRISTWHFISPLVSLPADIPGLPFAGDLGKNWEAANFVSLRDSNSLEMNDFLIFGTEGRLPPFRDEGPSKFRVDHAQMWMCGKLAKGEDHTVKMHYQYGGFLDHGAYYAGNSFWDPKAKRQVIVGWLLEEDLPVDLRRRQGWAGVLSLPRVLSLQTVKSVVGTLRSNLDTFVSVGLMKEDGIVADNGCSPSYTVTTLCAVPDERIKTLRSCPKELLSEHFERGCPLSLSHGPEAWEMDMAFDIGASVRKVGLVIGHSPGMFSNPLPRLSVSSMTLVLTTCSPSSSLSIENKHHLRPTHRNGHYYPSRSYVIPQHQRVRRSGAAHPLHVHKRKGRKDSGVIGASDNLRRQRLGGLRQRPNGAEH